MNLSEDLQDLCLEKISVLLSVKLSSEASNALQPVLDLQMFDGMWDFGYSKIPCPLKKVWSILVFPWICHGFPFLMYLLISIYSFFGR